MNRDELYFYFRDLMAKRHGLHEARRLEVAMTEFLDSRNPESAWNYARSKLAALDLQRAQEMRKL